MMVSFLREKMDPNVPMRLVVKQGPRGRWRWQAYHTEGPRAGKCGSLCPVRGFETEAEARADAHAQLKVVEE